MRIRSIHANDMEALFEVRIRTWHNDQGAEELAALGITHASVRDQIESGTHRGWLCCMNATDALNSLPAQLPPMGTTGPHAEQVVGFAMGDRETGEMWVIAVLPEFEGQGIGRQLLSRVEDWLFECGWSEIWLTTDLDPEYRAVGFYRHLGWQDWKLDGDRFMRKFRDLA